MKAALISVGVILLAALLAIGFFTPYLVWDGGVRKNLKLAVIEAVNHKPVAGVEVFWSPWLPDQFQQMAENEQQEWIASLAAEFQGLTDANGQTELSIHLPAGGSQSWLRKSGTYRIRGHLVARKNGQVLWIEPLKELIEDRPRHLKQSLPEARIEIP